MSILIDKGTRLLVQGITGRDGSFHSKQMLDYGTNVVAGVTPGKGGQSFEGKVPVFNTVADAVSKTGANTAISSALHAQFVQVFVLHPNNRTLEAANAQAQIPYGGPPFPRRSGP